MSYFLIAIAVVALGLALVKAASTVQPMVLVLWIKRLIAAGLAAAAILMFITGRVPVALMLASFAVMALRGGGVRWGRLGGKPAPGQSSSVETDALSMNLDHDTGEMEGTIKRGEFTGRNLGDLSKPELLDLLETLKHDDQQSAAVLVAYLDRRFGSDWQDDAAGQGQGQGQEQTQGRGPWSGGARSGPDGPITREMALDILGLAKGASRDDIIQAHRQLMQKLHPDHGGSGYLASRINAARDLLLGS